MVTRVEYHYQIHICSYRHYWLREDYRFQHIKQPFQWTHIQNDNISKKAKLKICDLTLLALEDDDQSVVLFDRNNSASRERRQIFTTIDQKEMNIWMIQWI